MSVDTKDIPNITEEEAMKMFSEHLQKMQETKLKELEEDRLEDLEEQRRMKSLGLDMNDRWYSHMERQEVAIRNLRAELNPPDDDMPELIPPPPVDTTAEEEKKKIREDCEEERKKFSEELKDLRVPHTFINGALVYFATPLDLYPTIKFSYGIVSKEEPKEG